MSKKNKVKKNKDDPKFYYNDIPLDSIGEWNLCLWMEELKQAGYIINYTRGESYLLSDSFSNNYVEQLKTKSRPKSQTILMGHSYNYDFIIEWSEKGLKQFCNRVGEKWVKPFLINSKSMSFVEAKPAFDYNNMTRLATLNVKWMWQKYQIFVQVVKNEDLFAKTFTPKALFKTKNGKDRVMKWKVRTLEQYLSI